MNQSVPGTLLEAAILIRSGTRLVYLLNHEVVLKPKEIKLTTTAVPNNKDTSRCSAGLFVFFSHEYYASVFSKNLW